MNGEKSVTHSRFSHPSQLSQSSLIKQATTGSFAKGRLSRSKRRPFAGRKATFCKPFGTILTFNEIQNDIQERTFGGILRFAGKAFVFNYSNFHNFFNFKKALL